jgi:mannose-6-phosphate isomerase-like protein (cupin superfamily)
MERANDPLVTLSGHKKEATAMSDPRVVESGEGEAYVLLGSEHITFKRRGVPGEECSIFENATQAGYQGPSPHLHHNQDEDFYVLEGRFEFRVQGRTAEGGPGTFVHSPKGTVHTFRNIGEAVGKLLVTVSPAGGFEDVVEEFGEPTQEKSPPLRSGAPDAATAERYEAVASKHGIEIVPSSSDH